MIVSGDLLNQIISASSAARDFSIPFLGVYGACSKMTDARRLCRIHRRGTLQTRHSGHRLRPALLQMIGGDFTAISQIWIFIVGPILGAAVAAILYRFLESKKQTKE